MTRLRTVSPDMPGWRRRRHGRGFVYLDSDGSPLCRGDKERCVALVIPPAWIGVWICPAENGHLQAVGTDEAGRRQYLYHPDWRIRRDREKFEHMCEFAAKLPSARRRVSRDLGGHDLTYERAAATAFRLFDLGVFRLGSERYVEENGSYGLVTLERRHVRKSRDGITFGYVAKSGLPRSLVVRDKAVLRAIDDMRVRRSSSGQRLLAYKSGNRWSDLTSEAVNAYIKDVIDEDASAKDFRTWHANVLAAAILATQQDLDTTSARNRAITETMRRVADYLGNTAAVARSAYVDSRLIDLYQDGTTIERALAHRTMPESGVALRPSLELAVLDLLNA